MRAAVLVQRHAAAAFPRAHRQAAFPVCLWARGASRAPAQHMVHCVGVGAEAEAREKQGQRDSQPLRLEPAGVCARFDPPCAAGGGAGSNADAYAPALGGGGGGSADDGLGGDGGVVRYALNRDGTVVTDNET
jgi:hypothetical protein